MTVRKVRVRINHSFKVDIPDELLADDRADELDELIAYHFEDEGYYFDDLEIYDVETGRPVW